MKKQNKPKKLTLKKETLTYLQQVTGGAYLYNTVYYRWDTDNCGEEPIRYA